MSAYIHVRTQIEFGKGARMIEQKFRCVSVLDQLMRGKVQTKTKYSNVSTIDAKKSCTIQ